jgi:predicted amidophosphoribosyltransferase
MSGALALAPSAGARAATHLVLIDDVVTTGETVRAAIALFPPGKVVGVVAVALVLAPPRRR